jgi:hypothetical protein
VSEIVQPRPLHETALSSSACVQWHVFNFHFFYCFFLTKCSKSRPTQFRRAGAYQVERLSALSHPTKSLKIAFRMRAYSSLSDPWLAVMPVKFWNEHENHITGNTMHGHDSCDPLISSKLVVVGNTVINDRQTLALQQWRLVKQDEKKKKKRGGAWISRRNQSCLKQKPGAAIHSLFLHRVRQIVQRWGCALLVNRCLKDGGLVY